MDKAGGIGEDEIVYVCVFESRVFILPDAVEYETDAQGRGDEKEWFWLKYLHDRLIKGVFNGEMKRSYFELRWRGGSNVMCNWRLLLKNNTSGAILKTSS